MHSSNFTTPVKRHNWGFLFCSGFFFLIKGRKLLVSHTLLCICLWDVAPSANHRRKRSWTSLGKGQVTCFDDKSCVFKLEGLRTNGSEPGFWVWEHAFGVISRGDPHSPFTHSFNACLLLDVPDIALGIEDTVVDKTETEHRFPFVVYILGCIYVCDVCWGPLRF